MFVKDKFIIALDQGTTSSRAVLINIRGEIVDLARQKINTYYPNPGWVEQDPIEILNTQLCTLEEIVARNRLKLDDMCAIGIANQRETTILWNKHTGKPVYNAITWQDKRTSDYCNHLKTNSIGRTIRDKTGLMPDAYFSATKIKWLLDNIPDLRQQAENGEILFGTIDSWLLYNITKERNHFTDITNASRTMLLNIHTESWDDDLLKIFNIPKIILPQIKPNDYNYGHLKQTNIQDTVIASVIGDQQAALFGQLCFEPGHTKITYGTGCFLMTSTGKQKLSVDNILTTIACKLGNNTTYALEGSIFTAGSIIQWLKNNLFLLESTQEIEALAISVRDSAGVQFVPAFSGLGAPYWDQDARGVILGITAQTQRAHIARAAIESIALQVLDLLLYMKNRIKKYSTLNIKVDGGMTQNKFLMQFQADILQQVIKNDNVEATAIGAAYIAGLSQGYWPNIESLPVTNSTYFEPKMSKTQAGHKYKLWQKAIAKSIA
ncbi:MAG: glycerol kinase GlpK [Solitalea-like symbiont of Tyrophagus putrescentiae]